jgi:hypothetical protein
VYVGGPTEKAIEELDESERAAHQHPAGLCVSFIISQNADYLTTELTVHVFKTLLWLGRRRERYGWRGTAPRKRQELPWCQSPACDS